MELKDFINSGKRVAGWFYDSTPHKDAEGICIGYIESKGYFRTVYTYNHLDLMTEEEIIKYFPKEAAELINNLREFKKMSESKKHKHYDMIEEWARTGKQVQMRDPFLPGWVNCNPQWLDNVEYRFKPEAVKYKRYLTRNKQGELRMKIVYYGMENKGNISTNFVRWIDEDWQEVEV